MNNISLVPSLINLKASIKSVHCDLDSASNTFIVELLVPVAVDDIASIFLFECIIDAYTFRSIVDLIFQHNLGVILSYKPNAPYQLNGPNTFRLEKGLFNIHSITYSNPDSLKRITQTFEE